MKMTNLKITPSQVKILLNTVFLISFYLLHFTWSLSSPAGSSPDEDAHLISIYCIKETGTTPCENLNQKIVDIGYCYIFDSDQSAMCDLYSSNKSANASTRSQGENYFYKTLSYFASDNLELSILLMRGFNSLLITVIFGLIYFFMPLKIFVTSVSTWLIVNLPLGFFLVTSINTSSWLLIFTIVITLIAYLSFTNTNLSAALILMGLFFFFLSKEARPDTVLVTACILISYFPFLFNIFKNRKIFYIQFMFSIIFFVVFVKLIFDRSSIATSVREFGIPIWEHLYRITSIPLGVFGGWGLGSLELDLPSLVSVTANFLILGLIFLSLKFSSLESIFSKFYLTSLIYMIPLFVVYTSKLQVGEWYQPRYILPLFYPLIFISIFDILKIKKNYKNIIVIIGFFTLIIYTTSLHTILRRYTFGLGDFILNLNHNYEWWWQLKFMISPMSVLILGSISFSYLLFFIYTQLKKIPDFSNQ